MSALLKNPNYRNLLLAQMTSLAGTGISTIALALLAWDLAGENAGSVLGTALALKMVAYVFLAPIIGAWAHKLPRKHWLAGLDFIRAALILCLPFVTEIWQVYALILAINACSAGFTPVFQSVLPQILPDREDYLKALSWSRMAYDMEQLISPLLAGLLLSSIGFRELFVADTMTFVVSGILILFCTIPRALEPKRQKGIINNLHFGLSSYLKTPRLRALWGAYFAVASGSAMLIVNTVVYVKDQLNGGEQETALAMSVAGLGSMLIALKLPGWLKKFSTRSAILSGGGLITLALVTGSMEPGWPVYLLTCLMIGMGLSFIQTPAGVLVTRSCQESDAPAYFAANFSLSHFCWFLTYLLAGWSSAAFGLSTSYILMALIALAGIVYARHTFPNPDPEVLTHTHPPSGQTQAPVEHSHRFVIDSEHRRWPT
ncbi:MFS transporter [Endozoicomonas arenosclerae]|uniref:MFS transporter n=1 Tax=Endozoicomonas arenosclerae TaxID=1633495 RepID=UPI0009A1C32D|nr:MFS transporter [Endozoicomonas arenosclerae]